MNTNRNEQELSGRKSTSFISFISTVLVLGFDGFNGNVWTLVFVDVNLAKYLHWSRTL